MKKSALKKPIRSKDVPATRGMLYLVRDELNHSITSLEHKMVGGFKDVDARFNESDAKFKSIDARFKEIDARFDKMEARFEKIEAKLEQVLSAVHRIGLLVEEQNVRNKYVLDGYAQLYEQINKSKIRDT